MHTTKYLYNIEPKELSNLVYIDALELKVREAKKLIHNLMQEEYMTRDDQRVNAVFAAIKHTENLLKEINYGTIN